MKTILKSIITASLLLASSAASAQCPELEEKMKSLIDQVSAYKVEVTKCLSEERDVQREGHPMKRRHDMIFFVLPNKYSQLLDEMKKAFEDNGRGNPNCYGINSMSEASNGDGMGQPRRMMIGDNMADYVEIGKSYINYLNINILDTSDTTKTHRYGYALEWRATNDDKGMVGVRYTVTYAKIPSTSAIEVIKYKSSDKDPFKYFNFEDNRDAQKRYEEFFKGKKLDPKNVYRIKNARFQWNGKDYPIEKIDSVFRDAEKRGEQISKNLQKAFIKGNSVVVWADSIDHDNDPVTDVVLRLQQGEDVTVNDLLCNDNILLILSQLKQQYLAGQNTEFNAISIYTLCRKAYDGGFFSDSHSFEELEQIICEVDKLTEKAKTETDRRYFQMAREQLDKILKSRK